MSGAKHTPGPWKADDYDIITFDVGEGEAHIIATVAHSELGDAINIANARLIAKAPELLAALKDSVYFWCLNCDYHPKPFYAKDCDPECAVLKYLALIDEVKGGAE